MSDVSLKCLSKKQIEKMRHALWGSKNNGRPCRNFYVSFESDCDWDELVAKGFAKKFIDNNIKIIIYNVTYETAKLLYGKPISKKYFDKLNRG